MKTKSRNVSPVYAWMDAKLEMASVDSELENALRRRDMGLEEWEKSLHGRGLGLLPHEKLPPMVRKEKDKVWREYSEQMMKLVTRQEELREIESKKRAEIRAAGLQSEEEIELVFGLRLSELVGSEADELRKALGGRLRIRPEFRHLLPSRDQKKLAEEDKIQVSPEAEQMFNAWFYGPFWELTTEKKVELATADDELFKAWEEQSYRPYVQWALKEIKSARLADAGFINRIDVLPKSFQTSDGHKLERDENQLTQGVTIKNHDSNRGQASRTAERERETTTSPNTKGGGTSPESMEAITKRLHEAQRRLMEAEARLRRISFAWDIKDLEGLSTAPSLDYTEQNQKVELLKLEVEALGDVYKRAVADEAAGREAPSKGANPERGKLEEARAEMEESQAFLKDHSPDQLKADISEIYRQMVASGTPQADVRAFVWKTAKWICSNHEYKWENLKDPVQHKAFLFWMKDTFGADPEEVDAGPGDEGEIARRAAKVHAELEAIKAAHAEAMKATLHQRNPEDFDAWLSKATDEQLRYQLAKWDAHPLLTPNLGLRLESEAESRIKAEVEKRRIEGMVMRAVVDATKGTAGLEPAPKPERGEKAAAFREVLTALQVTATNQRKMRGRIKAEMKKRGHPVKDNELRAMLTREGQTQEKRR